LPFVIDKKRPLLLQANGLLLKSSESGFWNLPFNLKLQNIFAADRHPTLWIYRYLVA
jgi:hypothetical protein